MAFNASDGGVRWHAISVKFCTVVRSWPGYTAVKKYCRTVQPLSRVHQRYRRQTTDRRIYDSKDPLRSDVRVKSHGSALLDVWRFQSHGDKSAREVFYPLMSNTSVKCINWGIKLFKSSTCLAAIQASLYTYRMGVCMFVGTFDIWKAYKQTL